MGMPTPLPVITDVYRIALNWRFITTGATAENVMHLKDETGSSTIADIANKIITSAPANLFAHTTDHSQVGTISITPLDGTSSTDDFLTGTPVEWAGTATGEVIPASALLVKIGTGLRGRDNRGRLFLPFVAEGVNVNGVCETTTFAALAAAWPAWATALLGGAAPALSMGVAAYDRAHAGAGAHFTPFTSVLIESVLGTQRRRQTRLR